MSGGSHERNQMLMETWFLLYGGFPLCKTIQNLSIAIKEEPIFFSFPKDYEYFISKQQKLISSQFNGARQKIKDRKSFIFSLFSQLNDLLEKTPPLYLDPEG